jgi:rare lipoprotein A
MDGFGRRGRWGRIAQLLAFGAGCLALAACANGNMANTTMASRLASSDGVAVKARASRHTVKLDRHPAKKREVARAQHQAAPTREPALHKSLSYSAVGLASWYGAGFHGRRTADGETFNMNSLTAAHRTLPLPCNVRVTNLANHRSVVVRVNDRGPYAGHRLIDVSAETAKLLGFYDHGVAKVKIDYVGRAPLKRSGDRKAAAAE